MFVKTADFIAEWQQEAAATQRVMDTLTDEALNQAVTPDHRTLGQLAWHLTTTVHEMLSRTGLELASAGDDQHAPASAAAIAEAYRNASQAAWNAVQTQWTDAKLAETTEMYGDTWPNGLTLRILIQHQIHHRGQMTVLMRQAGLRVPDIYGPTREDWLERGMQPLV
ncbi:DinB family protein [Paenibacillus ehimensis]|uniref:DinB family protein n=1 Tax=Paenibacillus ehimensis TaxID=79264 RepID=UPI002DBE76C2|nr:DinB family protein [Paenibacillus ehimensis]MEC0211692.1 DinB family protein [Paenibacillus ehimensis]